MKNNYPWLRFIEGPDGSAPTPAEENPNQGSTVEEKTPTNAGKETDYKSKYEAMKAHSREWEQKAKANLAAAKKLQEIEDAGKTELQKLTDLLEKERAEKRAIEVEATRLRIATQHGLSADDAELFLHGDAETMAKQAEALAKRPAAPDMRPKGLGVNPAQGRGSASSPVREDIIERAKKL